jgi:hypothetical protein
MIDPYNSGVAKLLSNEKDLLANVASRFTPQP